MSTRFAALLGLVCLLTATSAAADSLQLKDGTRLEGRFVGGTSEVVRFVVGDELHVVGVDTIQKLVFGDRRPAPAKGPSETPSAPVAQEPSDSSADGKPSEAAPLV